MRGVSNIGQTIKIITRERDLLGQLSKKGKEKIIKK